MTEFVLTKTLCTRNDDFFCVSCVYKFWKVQNYVRVVVLTRNHNCRIRGKRSNNLYSVLNGRNLVPLSFNGSSESNNSKGKVRLRRQFNGIQWRS